MYRYLVKKERKKKKETAPVLELLYARRIRPSSGGHSRSAAASARVWAATDPGLFRAWLETAPHSCLSSARRSASPVLHIVLRYSSVIKKKLRV
jgi:hypothetical protein